MSEAIKIDSEKISEKICEKSKNPQILRIRMSFGSSVKTNTYSYNGYDKQKSMNFDACILKILARFSIIIFRFTKRTYPFVG